MSRRSCSRSTRTKGGAGITVTARGVAAHTSTDRGESANFKVAPFLAEMADLVPVFRSEKRFQNPLFDPPTNGFNMVISDGDTALNVSAARTVVQLGIRAMPDACFEEAVQMVVGRAEAHGLEVEHWSISPFFASADGPLAQAACRATGATEAVTVPYGTEAECYQELCGIAGARARQHRAGPHRRRMDRGRAVAWGGGGILAADRGSLRLIERFKPFTSPPRLSVVARPV